jgi:hypothetical protein
MLARIPLIDSYVMLVRDNRDYRLLWFSQIVSLFGDWFNLIASAALVANLTGSGLAIGIVPVVMAIGWAIYLMLQVKRQQATISDSF